MCFQGLAMSFQILLLEWGEVLHRPQLTMWESEDNSVVLVLSFHLYTGVPGIEPGLPGLHDMCFHMLSHLLLELTS